MTVLYEKMKAWSKKKKKKIKAEVLPNQCWGTWTEVRMLLSLCACTYVKVIKC